MWAVLILIMQLTCCLYTHQSIAAVNHRSGLHLQLPDKLIDISASDLEEVEVFQTSPDAASVMLKLRPVLAERLYKLTAKAIGQPIVWIWNGRVLSVQTLEAPISHDVTVYNFTSFEAEDFKRKRTLTSSSAKAGDPGSG